MSTYIYARSAAPSATAVEGQVEKRKQFAEVIGLEIEGVFIDDGFSGLSDDRPDYNKLLQTATNGDTIIAVSAGSLTRDFGILFELEKRYKLVLLD